MSDAEEGGGYELQPLEPLLGCVGMCASADVEDKQSETESNDHSDKRSQKDKGCNFKNDVKLNCFKSVCHNGSSCKTSNKGV